MLVRSSPLSPFQEKRMKSFAAGASVLIVMTFVLLGISSTAPAVADEKNDEQPKQRKLAPMTSASVRSLLSVKIAIPEGLRQKVPVRLVIKYLAENVAQEQGQDLNFVFNKQAFKETSPDAGDVLDVDVELPALASLSLRRFLDVMLSQVPDAAYVIKEGMIEVTTVHALKIDTLLDQGVMLNFRETPLGKAIDELSDQTGLTIAVDPRCDDLLKMPVNLRTNSDMSVRGVLDFLADAHELKLVVSDHRVTLMPQAAYLKRLKDRADEVKLQREIDPNFEAGAPPRERMIGRRTGAGLQ
jgi:hypothetical protein